MLYLVVLVKYRDNSASWISRRVNQCRQRLTVPALTHSREMFNVAFRPGSHNQVFCTIFWHQSCEMSLKFMIHNCGHLSSIISNNPCENENQSLESLAEFLLEIEPRALFCQQVLKKPPLSTQKTKLLAVPLKIFVANHKKCRRGQHRKRMRHDYKAKL